MHASYAAAAWDRNDEIVENEPNIILKDWELFKFKSKFTNNIRNNSNVEMAVWLKYLHKFWRTVSLINCDININLSCLGHCVISDATRTTTFEITDTKLYVAVVLLSPQDNSKLLQQLKSGFKWIIQTQNYYL